LKDSLRSELKDVQQEVYSIDLYCYSLDSSTGSIAGSNTKHNICQTVFSSKTLHFDPEEAGVSFSKRAEPDEHPSVTDVEMDQSLKGLRKSAAPGLNDVTVLLLSLVFHIIKYSLMTLQFVLEERSLPFNMEGSKKFQ